MTFEALMDSIIGDTTTKANKLLDLWEAGDIDDGLFADALVYLVDQSRGRASSAALTVLRDYIETGIEAAALVTPALPDTATERLTKAATTILGSGLDTRMQVERLAAGETLAAAHRTYADTMAATPHVTGWTRGLDGGACELCQWWARDGRVWPSDHPMPTHTGCKCHPVPTVRRTE
ncbi:MAG: hypothetical protein ACQEVD_16185 [Actinomycetota bacterium]